MATLIPTLGAARFDARGELRLAERLKDCLEDNAYGQVNRSAAETAAPQQPSPASVH